MVFELVRWKSAHWSLDVIDRDITSGLRRCTKICGGFNPSHLEGGGYHNLNRVTIGTREYIAEIPFLPISRRYPPETILDIPLGTEYFCILRRCSKCVDYTLQ